MMFYGRSLFLFLVLVANGVESFTINTSGIPSTNTLAIGGTIQKRVEFANNNNNYKKCLTLSSLAAESTEAESIEPTEAEVGDVEKKTEVRKFEEEDISKIAYVVNLSYDTPGYKLREIFNEHGTVTKLFMPKEKGTGKPKGIAFVTMTSEEERDNTIDKLNETQVDGRTIYVDKAKPRSEKGDKKASGTKKLYVGNIAYETTKEELTEFFSQFGGVRDVYIPLDKMSDLPRGFAFVTMNNADAEKAIEEANGTDLQGRTIDVKESLPRGQRLSPPQRRNAETKLYVGNLSFDTDEETIHSVFEEFGTIIDLYQPLDRYSGRPRGFAFITMSPDDAASAIEATDGLELDGRILRVNEAQPKGYNTPKYDNWDEEDDWGEEE